MARKFKKEPWAGPLHYYQRRGLEDIGLPLPPWGIKYPKRIWSWNCNREDCKQVARFGVNFCKKHYHTETDGNFRYTFARLAKVIVEYANYKLTFFINELTDEEMWSYTDMILIMPRMISLQDRVIGSLTWAKAVEINTQRFKKYDEMNIKFKDEYMKAGGIIVDHYFDQLHKNNLSNNDILDRIDILIYWACDYLQMWSWDGW